MPFQCGQNPPGKPPTKLQQAETNHKFERFQLVMGCPQWAIGAHLELRPANFTWVLKVYSLSRFEEREGAAAPRCRLSVVGCQNFATVEFDGMLCRMRLSASSEFVPMPSVNCQPTTDNCSSIVERWPQALLGLRRRGWLD